MADNKDVQKYAETLPDEKGDKFYRVHNGNLYLFFETGKSALLPQHKAHIDRVAVPFLVRAVKRLGRGNYLVIVQGAASATGGDEAKNFTLSLSRAQGAVWYAIDRLNELQRTDIELAYSTFEDGAVGRGDGDSRGDRAQQGFKTDKQTETNQATFRAALFAFKAELNDTRDKEKYAIREVFQFKFEKINEDLPSALKAVNAWFDSNPLGDLAKEGAWTYVKTVLKEALKVVIEGIGAGVIDIGMSQITYAIPKSTDYCFEIRNYEDKHALYRFHSQAHSNSTSFISVLKTLLRVVAIFAKIRKLARFGKGIKLFEKFLKDGEAAYKAAETALKFMAKKAGKPVETMVETIFKDIESEKVRDLFIVAASKWEGFRFTSGDRSRAVDNIGGTAQRHSVSAAWYSHVTVRFGNTPNNLGFDAEAYFESWNFQNDFLGHGVATTGVFAVVKSGYGDLTI